MPLHLPPRFQVLFAHPLNKLLCNADARIETLVAGSLTLPCTVVDRIMPNCYTVSPYAALIGYARDELVKLPFWQRMLAGGLLRLLGGILHLTQTDRAATLNNYTLSTNTLPQALLQCAPGLLTRAASSRFPDHCLLIRSLNRRQHGAFIDGLQQQGWLPVVSRQVYLFEDLSSAMDKANAKRDQKLLFDGKFIFRQLHRDSPAADFKAAEHWYNMLYLEKYSRQNVQFSAFCLHEMVKLGILDLWLLEDAADGTSVGTAGLIGEDGILTAPIVGYDTGRPASDGLYRRIIAHVMHIVRRRGQRLNLSSGAPGFKLMRGAQAELEYTLVYCSHLPFRRRSIWRLLSLLSLKYYAHLLQKYRL